MGISIVEWDRVIETNMRGVFFTCQAAACRMVAAKRPGKVITISSGAHNSGRRGGARCCASKAGVVMFTKVLAMELGPHRVNVNGIAPGIITIDRDVSQVSDEVLSTLVSNIPWAARARQPTSRTPPSSSSPEADFIT